MYITRLLVPVLTLFLLIPAHSVYAGFGLVLPEKSVVEDPEKRTLKLTIGSVEPFSDQGLPLERPQTFTALRYSGEQADRSEHLSVLEETTIYGARAWTTEIALPYPGVYHFIMQSKASWLPDKDKFVQYIAKVQVPVHSSSEGWDMPTGMSFEIIPLSRPFGLCAGMAFSGQVMTDGKPVAGAVVEVAHLANIGKTTSSSLSTHSTKQPPKPAESSYQASQLVKTNNEGIFIFVCPFPGWWAFAASNQGDPLQDPEGQLKPLEKKTIFWVYMENCTSRAKK